MKYTRRTDEDRIAELAAKIEGIRVRAARANPTVRQAMIAPRAIERAIESQPEQGLGDTLQLMSIALLGALAGAVSNTGPIDTPPVPKRRARSRVASTR